ncbi:SCP2 sterol-binding domain-containing protein [Sporosarcina sp. 6E9]|uniref:SCP2 sterol-binding domain-containing protein n=1 Tax=Sporosarcina sp. 6E9 TaxID=2819235 RepID=UPI001B3186DF|nr:SCP2 sterol-binding domain-containing protein [Sporosarcina sp. 6E9]
MTSNFDNMTLEEIWNEIDVRLKEKPEPYKNMNAIYSIVLLGEDGGQFGLKFSDGNAETIIGTPDESDCALSMSVKDFKKLLGGNLNSVASYMMGKLKVKGNVGLALELENLLKKYSF